MALTGGLVNPRLKAELQAAGTLEENILCEPRDEEEASSFNSAAREMARNTAILLISEQEILTGF